ncbi:hypothetical protein H8356DRAFT_1305536 [Neocallimastix lanati (nom. inval.)]|jgi:hypothetical protein|uniref:Mid2 domain-containing protein n=1 Tax=Neocallimastix californiae TaxID=1754190 RepID=A0A1Y2F1W9_9FUNG|nr:hypothetical protein H8356DRAFT_1305536 [Neocallimastix sp. JGI-2020a]ORY77871.1 hypothetical protein LY90DRAFT_698416 [Neocallimastix californiae]|eukprot:ORY77871.1 hypothetical protein LY90DRAFT_698416 [Neocallimastix californiae]
MGIIKRSSEEDRERSTKEHNDDSNRNKEDSRKKTDTGPDAWKNWNDYNDRETDTDKDHNKDDDSKSDHHTTTTTKSTTTTSKTSTTTIDESSTTTLIKEKVTATITSSNLPTSTIEPSTQPKSNITQEKHSDMNALSIIGIIFINVAVIFIILCVLIFIIKKKRNEKEKGKTGLNKDGKPSIGVIYGTCHVDKHSAPFPYFEDICNTYTDNSEAFNNYNRYINTKYQNNLSVPSNSDIIPVNQDNSYGSHSQGSSYQSANNLTPINTNVNVNRPYGNRYQSPVYQNSSTSYPYQTVDITQSIPPQNHIINSNYSSSHSSSSSPIKEAFSYQPHNIKLSDMKY